MVTACLMLVKPACAQSIFLWGPGLKKMFVMSKLYFDLILHI